MSLSNILDPTAITGQITNNLKKILGNKELEMDIVSSGDEVIYAFYKGTNGKYISDLELNQKVFVIPIIIPSKSEPFWMSYSLTFKRKDKIHFYFFQASVRVFKGKQSDSKMWKVFRAEWMVESDVTQKAQPHWHIHNFLTDKIQDTKETFKSEEETVIDFGEESKAQAKVNVTPLIDNFSDFHFAMSSQWHKKGGTHFNNLEDMNALRLWTEGCVSYIIIQLGNLSRITHPSS